MTKPEEKLVVRRMRNKHGTPVLKICIGDKPALQVFNPGTKIRGYVDRAVAAVNARG